jgi:hypothetical protein
MAKEKPAMATKTETAPSLLNVLRTARADVTAFVNRGIDAAEKRTRLSAKSLFKFARSITKRLAGTKRK